VSGHGEIREEDRVIWERLGALERRLACSRCAILHACVWLMFFLGLVLAGFSFAAGRGFPR